MNDELEPTATDDEPAMPDTPEVEVLRDNTPDPVAASQAEIEALRDQKLRLQADFDNYRKRVARDMEQLRKTAAEGLIQELLPVVDNLERALSHGQDRMNPLVQGMELVLRQFQDVLAARGLVAIEGLGQQFDPNLHEALAHQPSAEHPENAIMLEYERGYKLGDAILRPARVVVSSGPPIATPTADAAENGPESSNLTQTETDTEAK